jgi:hypothetical protein
VNYPKLNLALHDFCELRIDGVLWTCPGTVDTFPSRSVLFYQSNLLELGGAQIS